MIKELGALTGIDFQFSSDKELREYLDEVNGGKYADKLLEKDFYLTALLGWISKELPMLSFKGGTCLNKIHFPYFRLSEDLDFSMDATDPLVDNPGKRERFATKTKEKLQLVADTMGRSFDRRNDRARGNKYLWNKKFTYLKYTLGYKSLYGGDDTIKIEVTYTHKQHIPSVMKAIKNEFIDIVSEESIFPYAEINCYALEEMIAEKTRAALTREKPAIRDFFDLWYLKFEEGIDITSDMDLIAEKCEDSDWRWTIYDFVPSREEPDVIQMSYPFLKNQIDEYLIPVLINKSDFSLKDIYDILKNVKNILVEKYQGPN